MISWWIVPTCADVAEMADATDLGSVDRKVVEVRVLSSAPRSPDAGPWPSGKAPPLHGGDRRFESDRVHLMGAPVAMPCFIHHHAGVVQR